MDFYAASWQCRDVATDSDDLRRCEVICHGKRTEDSQAVCLRIPFHPFLYVEVPERQQTTALAAKGFMYSLLDETRGLKKDLCRLVRRKPFVGFRNGEKRLYVELFFENLASFKRVKYNCKHTVYEAACDPLLKFLHSSGLPATGWMRVDRYGVVPLGDASRISRDTVVECLIPSVRDVHHGLPEMETVTPPLVMCSWDIEAYSKSGNFPDASVLDDAIITIGAVYAMVGTDEPFHRSVHVLGTCHDIEGVDVHRYTTEASLVMGFIYETIRFRTDFLLAWNSYGFDHRYIDGRAVTLIDYETGESLIDLKAWGRLDDPETGMLMEKRLASSAYGDNTYYYQYTPGMCSVDALQIFRKETKHDSYTLDNISRHYLGGLSKMDLKPWQIFDKFRETDPTGRTEIAEYCVRDCELPLKLVHKMNMLNNVFEFSKVTSVPVDWLLLRGQQIRVYSLLLKHARAQGFVVPDMQASPEDDTTSFTGAIVLDPVPGGYTEDICCVMDFASLYPSIMMAHHMCGSTLVLDPAYRQCEGVEYYDIEAAPGVTVSFAQTKDNVIPNLLYDLKRMRKQAKKDMETAENQFTRGLLDSRQLSYKLVMNSLYGALGSNHGLLCGLKKIPMSVTATGRWMINETKRLVETLNPGSKVVYGDSVAEWTPITIRYNGQMEIVTFEDLAARVTWTPRSDGKEVAHHDDLQIWSDQSWTPVNAIIRHMHTDPLVRVATHTGVVDVTAHHSLLRPNGEMVKPSEVSIGDDLMHVEGPSFETKQVIRERDIKFARILGFFIGDGSCGNYRSPSGVKASWTLNNSDHKLLIFYKRLLEEVYPTYGWKINDTLKSSGVYKLVPHNHEYGSISVFVKEWKNMCYSGEAKIIPRFIHESDCRIKREFLEGFYDADDGIKNDSMRFDQKHQITCAHFYRMLRSIGYKVSISTRVDKPLIFRLTGTPFSYQRKTKTPVKKMYDIPYNGYVYDVSTGNHHFAAGVGDMVVHNTDSVLCILNCGDDNRQNLTEHFRVAEDLAVQITTHFLPPHELEMEKAFFPFFLVTKKRYTGLKYEHPDTDPTIDIKGLQLVRRDSPKLVKRISHGMLEILLYQRSFDLAMQYVQREILRILDGDVPFEEFVMSKSMRSSYKNQNLPHLIVARKRRERGVAPFRSGERVPFVYVQSDLDLGISQRAEDAEYAQEHQVPIDLLYYINNQVLTPVVTLLNLGYPQATQGIMQHPDIAEKMVQLQALTLRLKKTSKRVRTNTANKQREITSFFRTDS